MPPLPRDLRSRLDKTVAEARDVAEAAAAAALAQLGVGDGASPAYLTPDQRALRNRLRAHGRQLGDELNRRTGVQETANLIEHVAYEHWHRMLFARFLAENGLLMYTAAGAPVPVSLEECEDLAEEEGAANGWELAARFASTMLPQIFRPDSPVFGLALPPERQRALETLLAGLPPELFTASDALGWVYQFWQSKRKDQINKSEVKIGARELPAVTQLFTEPYMVAFLLDNGLGAWWAAQRLSADDLRTAPDEETLRARAALPGMPLSYLRFVRTEDRGDGSGAWAPAAGAFDGWPRHLRELKVLDPCCGSGHFLVAALHMLVPLRMEREGLSAHAAVDAVLRDNLHGLEIDARCVEIAAFALALAAWSYPDAGGYRPLPPIRVACSGLAVGSTRAEWLEIAHHAADRIMRERKPALLPEADKESIWHTQLKAGMGALYDLFAQAPLLGSLIDPNRVERDFFTADFVQVRDLLRQALGADDTPGDEDYEAVVAAQGMAEAAEMLAGRYHWVITNVPYLARGKQNDDLKAYADDAAPDAKADLATLFLDRCLTFCPTGSVTSIVLPQNWLFLTSYRRFRERLLTRDTWRLLARMGEGSFESSAAAGAFNILLMLCSGRAPQDHLLRGLDVAEERDAVRKASALLEQAILSVTQAAQLRNPDARVVLSEHVKQSLLSKEAECYVGVLNGDSPRFQRLFWELPQQSALWAFQQTTVDSDVHFGGLHLRLYFDMKEGHLREEAWIRREKLHDSDQRGNKAWGSRGVSISAMRELPVALYTGATFDSNVAIVFPGKPLLIPAIWCYCSSPEYEIEVRKIDQSLKVTNATLVQVPFDPAH